MASASSFSHLHGWQRLLAVVAQLRDPQDGCPWDLKQTHQTLRPYILEEAYELVEALGSNDSVHIQEELGDVLLQVALHAQLAQEAQQFDAEAVAEGIAQKLIRRHPHVFGEVTVGSAEEVTANWHAIKQAEKAQQNPSETPNSAMDGISTGQPALSRALAVSKRAVEEGFEWPNFESLWACVLSEYDEFLHERTQNAPYERLEDELGDILFATVNLARFHNIDPEVALTRATQKFMQRYRTMEQLSDKPLKQQPFETLDALWTEAKAKLHQTAHTPASS